MSRAHDDFGEDEPIRGLPERLPEGERILWQGAPAWQWLALRAYHVGIVVAYFLVLMAYRGYAAYQASGDLLAAGAVALSPLPFALVAVGLLSFLAWLSSKTTVYTITNRRVALRIGIALPSTINVPFSVVAEASFRPRFGNTGDISLQLRGPDRIGFAHLWPHVRPWRLRLPNPMLRSVPNGDAVAKVLAAALRDSLAERGPAKVLGEAPKDDTSAAAPGEIKRFSSAA